MSRMFERYFTYLTRGDNKPTEDFNVKREIHFTSNIIIIQGGPN